MGKSSCSSEAPRSAIRSKVRSTTSSGRASIRSTLLTTKMGLRSSSMALRSTKRVCGIGPSAASTRSRHPSTMPRTRSTSPPKSVWPGVSTMLILTPSYSTAVFLARMVMPRSFSRTLLSMARSEICCPWPSSRVCWSRPSTRVVLPWSTCEMMAMLRYSTCSPDTLLSPRHERLARTRVGDPSNEKGRAVRALEPRVYRMKGHGSNGVRYRFLVSG